MAHHKSSLPSATYLILLFALTAGPAIVTAALILIIDARVPDFSKGTDIAQFAIALVLGFAIWGVGFRAYWGEEKEAANRKVAVIAKIQPAFWFLGMALGTAAAFGIIDSALATRATLAAIYCDDVLPADDARVPRCMDFALPCDDETDAGACGKIGSPAAAERCVAAFDARHAALTAAQRTLVPKPDDGDYADAMRSICIVERLSTE